MDANKLIIGGRYIYQMLDGKEVEVSHTGNDGDGRYVFHTRGWNYRFVFGPDTVKDRVSESYDEHTTIDRNCI